MPGLVRLVPGIHESGTAAKNGVDGRDEPDEPGQDGGTAGATPAQGPSAGRRRARLVAAAAEPMPPTALVQLESDGVILIYGRDERAIEAAHLLKDRLDVTVLLDTPGEIAPPRVTAFPVVK